MRIENKIVEKSKVFVIIISFVITFSGCAAFQSNSNVAPKEMIPDYQKPKDQYVALDFFTLTSDFLNDHKSKYIVFEGYYSGMIPHPVLYFKGKQKKTKDMQSFYVREEKHSVHNVRVVYPDDHKNDARSLESLNRLRSKIKVFAFILPPGKPAVLKNGNLFHSFDETLIWLINVVVVYDDGIHY